MTQDERRLCVTFPLLNLGRELKQTRKARGLTLRAVCEVTGMKMQTVHNAENGMGYLRNTMRVAKGVGITTRAAIRATVEDLRQVAREVGLDE